ncbi:MAG: carboxypeptidase regulatory-like domain-containing protein [Deltaproteobacteria bacterium]|nr:carboxypeptidase regulatory-like domain-containing protein [Deltaproteobacteria bacterium]
MRPGSDCRRCHSKDSDYPSAPEWTLAGTVYPLADSPAEDGVEGVTVKVTAPDGAEVLSLTTNRVGNFYTSKPLPADYRVALEYQGERIEMPCPPPSGGCAKCHGQPPIGEAPGRIYVPQGEVRPNPAFDCEAWATVPTASASGN